MAEDRDVQRRPEPGVRWVRDADFVERLRKLLDEKRMTSEQVAELVRVEMGGYKCDASLIRKLKDPDLTKTPSSAFIGPLCRVFGWPVPPVADRDQELGSVLAVVYELERRDPAAYAKLAEFGRRKLQAARADGDLEDDESTTTPEESGE